MWTWNAAYHSVRARALLSILFYLSTFLPSTLFLTFQLMMGSKPVGPTLIGPIQGYLLDNPKWRRQSRARCGVVLFTVIALLTCEFLFPALGGLSLRARRDLWTCRPIPVRQAQSHDTGNRHSRPCLRKIMSAIHCVRAD